MEVSIFCFLKVIMFTVRAIIWQAFWCIWILLLLSFLNILHALYGLWELFFGNHWQVQLEPTTSLALLRRELNGPSKYTGIVQASRDIFREEGLPVLAAPCILLFSLVMQFFFFGSILVTSLYWQVTIITVTHCCNLKNLEQVRQCLASLLFFLTDHLK